MLSNLILGVPTMVVCLLLQSVLFAVAIRSYIRHQDQVKSPSFWSTLMVIAGVMLLLVIGNLAQVSLWAMLFVWLGEFDSVSDAVYHSAVNFSTLGYGDIVMSEERRLLGPLESINGILMIGVSTAALVTIFQDAMRKTLNARQE